MLDRSDKKDAVPKHDSGHKLGDLWNKIKPDYQELIAGMFRNNTGTPLLNASNRRIALFIEALRSVGDNPFVRWRYAYEEPGNTLMSHGAVAEVLDALGRAAEYVMEQRTKTV